MMGDRYFITGVQLGCLMSQSLNKKEIKHILDEIHEKQYICKREELHKILKNISEGGQQ